MGPVVTEMVYILPFGNIGNLIAAAMIGITIGYVLAPLSAHTASMHMGYNLFNVGFSAGIIAFVLVCILQSFGIQAQGVLIWQEETPVWLYLWIAVFFIAAIIYGLYWNGRDLKKALKQAGIESLLVCNRNQNAINPAMLDCDYYRFLKMDVPSINTYTGEFMTQYSWAEFVAGYLDRITTVTSPSPN
jgi:hypothetical protein